MMTYRKRSILVLSLTVILAAGLNAQEEGGHRFIKIVHSSDGTMAVDSLGEVWYYDEESGDFIRADQYREIRSESSDYGMDESAPIEDDFILPPEERCCDITYGDVSDFFNDIVIGIDERVEGKVIGGRDVIVNGLVTGDVVCLRTVTVTRYGEVRGDVIARKIRKESGGRILGTRKEVPFPKLPGIDIVPRTGIMSGLISISITLMAIFLTLIVLALFSEPTRRIVAKIRRNTVASFFWGLLFWFSLAPLFVLLLITIIGIPIAILVYPLVVAATIVLAYVAAAYFIGERLTEFLRWPAKSKYLKAIIGVVVLELSRALFVLGALIGFGFLENLFLVIFIVINFLALTIGLGAVITSRFGRKPKDSAAADDRPMVPPSPPKIPETPSPVPAPPTPPPPDSKNATD